MFEETEPRVAFWQLYANQKTPEKLYKLNLVEIKWRQMQQLCGLYLTWNVLRDTFHWDIFVIKVMFRSLKPCSRQTIKGVTRSVHSVACLKADNCKHLTLTYSWQIQSLTTRWLCIIYRKNKWLQEKLCIQLHWANWKKKKKRLKYWICEQISFSVYSVYPVQSLERLVHIHQLRSSQSSRGRVSPHTCRRRDRTYTL